MDLVIDVRGLVKDYGAVRAVKGVELRVGGGVVFGLIGPNGAGKTTIIRCLTGQVRPTAGEVNVLGVDVNKDPVGVRKVVGIIPEQESPPSFLTAEEYIHFVGSIRGVRDVGEQADFWFRKLDFTGERNMLCKDLSRGTRQKLMIAQAFIHRPRLLLIDEPLVNLDPLVQKVVKDYVRSYVKGGNTVFMSSHLLEVMEELADEVAILNRGRIIAGGSLKEVLSGRAHLEDVFLDLVGADHA